MSLLAIMARYRRIRGALKRLANLKKVNIARSICDKLLSRSISSAGFVRTSSRSGNSVSTDNILGANLPVDCIEPKPNCDVITRPSKSITSLITTDGIVLPYKLRPKTNNISDKPSGKSASVIGYRIINISKMLKHMNDFLHNHSVISPNCVPQISYDSDQEIVRGLCVSETIYCTSCLYQSFDGKMYNEDMYNADQTNGRHSGDLNIRLALGLQNTGIGVQAIRELFAILDIPAPSHTGLQLACNKVSDQLTSLSKDVMCENREKVRKVMNICHKSDIIVESDASYNNAPKGRSFSQPGTQSFCPLIEQNTSHKFIVAHTITNKLCKRCQLYGKKHSGTCSANYDEYAPIGNSERSAATQNMNMLLEDLDPLLPKIVVTDNDGKIVCGMNDALSKKTPELPLIIKEDCAVHVSRTQRRRCMSANWSIAFAGRTGTPARKMFVHDMTVSISKRCSAELCVARRELNNNDEFIERVKAARHTIIPCFCGDHTCCSKSFVCPKRHRRKPHARHLPQKKFLTNMTDNDKIILEQIVNIKLSDSMIQRQLHVSNTNQSEATHKKVFRALPKSNTFSRNVYGRVGTQIISASIGRQDAILKSCNSMKIPLSPCGPGKKTLMQLSQRDSYYNVLRKTRPSKRRRMKLVQKRMLKKRSRGSQYETSHMHPELSAEHNYGANGYDF